MFVLAFVLFLLVMLVMDFHGAQSGGFGEAGNVVVFGGARESIHVPREGAVAAAQAHGRVGAVGVVGGAYRYLAVEAVRGCARDAPGVDVHDAADRAGTVEQGARPLHHLDSFGEERLDGDGVVGAADRHVHGVDAIFHHAHPRAVHAVDDGAPHGGAEGGGVDAGLARNGIADAGGGFAVELLAVQGDGGFGEALAGKRVGGDDDFLDGVVLAVLGGCRRGDQ